MIKILTPIDITDLLRCYQQIENDIQWTNYGHKGKQAGLQYQNDEDPWTSCVGKSKGDDLGFTNINCFFQYTPFEKIINKFNLSRTRLMWVGSYACYSMHRDSTLRIHIPLITNSECYFLFKSENPVHLDIGYVYLIDTRKFHTFINCSDEPRLHLVGAVDC